MDDSNSLGWHAGESGPGRQGGDEAVERRLARFAFVREEGDREVRLLFRSVSPTEVAAAFRAAGARLLSIAGERAASAEPSPGNTAARKPGKGEARTPPTSQPQELTLRYFFALDEAVYTVCIAVPGGEARSVAEVYPAARAIEDELTQRLGANFTR